MDPLPTRRRLVPALFLFFTLAFAGSSLPAAGLWLPTPAAPIHWQWQIGTGFNLATDIVPHVTVYDLDLFETSAATVAALHHQGCIVIAYIDVGTFENFRPDAGRFPASVKGKTNGWPGERWLDIRALPVLGPILQSRFDLAQSKGFDAVEPDNVDGFANQSGFPLTAKDQLAFNRWVAAQCHQRGLSVGLKNDVDQLAQLQPAFDWALNEESYKYHEYSGYSVFLKSHKAVFEVEYTAATPQAAAMNALHINSLSLDLNLVGPTAPGYRRKPCIPDTQDTW
jgi:hypothetical protein